MAFKKKIYDWMLKQGVSKEEARVIASKTRKQLDAENRAATAETMRKLFDQCNSKP